MDAHTRKVYVPMTETGFYILLCLREPIWNCAEGKRTYRWRDCACTRNHVWESIEDGEGWDYSICQRRRKTEIICNNRSWMGSPEAGISQN